MSDHKQPPLRVPSLDASKCFDRARFEICLPVGLRFGLVQYS